VSVEEGRMGFDPQVVEAFRAVEHELEVIAKRLAG
jgi:response regulator RpfG family c-di-GMP phosphodiesterase